MVDTSREHQTHFIQGAFEDISEAEGVQFLCPSDGKVTKVVVVLLGEITVAPAGVQVSGGEDNVISGFDVVVAGSGAGVITTHEVTQDNDVSEGEILTIATDGGSTSEAGALWCVWITRN